MYLLNKITNTILFISFIPIYIIGIPITFFILIKRNKKDPDLLLCVFMWPLYFIAMSYSSCPIK